MLIGLSFLPRAPGALRWLRRADGARRRARRGVERDGGANERLQRLRIDLVALAQIDGAPGIAVEAGVEQPGRVRQCGALREGHLDDVLVGLAGADDAGVRPHRDAAPLPLLD